MAENNTTDKTSTIGYNSIIPRIYKTVGGGNAYSTAYNSSTTFQTDTEYKAQVLDAITYAGSAVSIVGLLLTLISYIGYRKFKVKRPHIVMVNICICLLFYYLSYIASNSSRKHSVPTKDINPNSTICLISAIICQMSTLSTWGWITTYWVVLLIMYRRPQGGHVSHFFIKSAAPSYGIPLLITLACVIVAKTNQDIEGKHPYYSNQCFVKGLYLYNGVFLPCLLFILPILAIFVIVLKGVCNTTSPDSGSISRVKSHLIRLTTLTMFVIIMILSAEFLLLFDVKSFAPAVIFSLVSTGLGLVLMILFCLNQEEIRSHWVSVARGKHVSIRKGRGQSSRDHINQIKKSSRHSSSLHMPSVYIEDGDISDQRKSSTFRILPKQDTDMTTLALVQIPGTPSPSHALEVDKDDKNKLKRKSRDVGKDANGNTQEEENLLSLEQSRKNDADLRKSKYKSGITSPKSLNSKQKSTKRQASESQLLNNNKQSKVNAGARMVARFARKSVRSVSDAEDTVPITSSEGGR